MEADAFIVADERALLPVANAPLVAHAIRQAKDCRRTYVVTASERVSRVATDYGARVVTVGPGATEDRVLTAISKLAVSPDVVVMLEPANPFMLPEDVNAAVGLVRGGASSAFVAAPFFGRVWEDDPPEGINHIPFAPRMPVSGQWMEAGAYAIRFHAFKHKRQRYTEGVEIAPIPSCRCMHVIDDDSARHADILLTELRQQAANDRRSEFARRRIQIGDRWVGGGEPVYIIAEIGINHDGELEIARRLIDVAVSAGCDAVKFQKRTPELCVPDDQKALMRETRWGRMRYIDYKQRMELGQREWQAIVTHCRAAGIHWFASCWDVPSVEFIERLNPVAHKVASAMLTNAPVLEAIKQTGKPVIASTGMSYGDEIDRAVEVFGQGQLALLHSTSEYPCPPEHLNLSCIRGLNTTYGLVSGYSGHESGLQTTVAAVAMGAKIVERHITLDRARQGTDHAASLEPDGLRRLVRDIRITEQAMGDGIKRVYPGELAAKRKLRGAA